MKGGKLIIFSAPSGSGKTTIVRHLLGCEDLNLAFSVSATSRPRRGKEKNKEDVAGGLRIKKKFPEQTLAVFVKPPSVDELKIRLKKRSTETDDKINMRIAKASVELATAPQFDSIIKNYDLEIALKEAEELVADFVNKKGTE